jgi:hypothetical protein
MVSVERAAVERREPARQSRPAIWRLSPNFRYSLAVMSVRVWSAVLALSACGSVVLDPRPGASRPISVLMYAQDPELREPAKQILASYPRVTVETIETLAPNVQLSILDNGCAQASTRGHDYFALAELRDKHHGKYVCDTLASPLDIVDPKARCASGHFEDESTTATFDLRFFTAATCRASNNVKIHTQGHAEGASETSKPAAREQALANARAR